jgi:hypothetical protein
MRAFSSMDDDRDKSRWPLGALYALLPNAGWDAIKYLVGVAASGIIALVYRRLALLRGLPQDSLIDVGILVHPWCCLPWLTCSRDTAVRETENPALQLSSRAKRRANQSLSTVRINGYMILLIDRRRR